LILERSPEGIHFQRLTASNCFRPHQTRFVYARNDLERSPAEAPAVEPSETYSGADFKRIQRGLIREAIEDK
jgi:hypothetical protein